MGSFVGHVIPGTFFLLFAVWWTIQILRHYFRSLHRDSAPYASRVTFPITVNSRGRRINVDSWLAVSLTVTGIIVEVIAAPLFRGSHVVGSTNTQHATMYFFFGLLGAMTILLSHFPLLPHRLDVEYLFLVLAFTVEALLFKFHLFGRDGTNVLLHILLVYCIYGCILATILEMRDRSNVIYALLRTYFTILQGTWFWQVALFLYRPGVDAWGRHGHHGGSHGNDSATAREEHETMMLYTCSFTWHMGGVFLFMTVVAMALYQYYRRKGISDDTGTYPLRDARKINVHYRRVEDVDDVLEETTS